MSIPRRARGVLASLAAAGLVVGLVGAPTGAEPPSPAPVPTPRDEFGGPDVLARIPYDSGSGAIWRNGTKTPLAANAEWAVAGQFSNASGGDLLLYNPGSTIDAIVHISPAGVPSFRSITVNGSYRPVIGDFDGNFVDDILWYRAGTGADVLWRFAPDGSHSVIPVTVNGAFNPVVADTNGDGNDDIIWYAPGTKPDVTWLFDDAAGHTTKAVSINGTYIAVVGEFGQPVMGQPRDRVVWYSQTGPDSIWSFNSAGTQTSYPLPNLSGDYLPMPGQFIEESYGGIFWYKPGSGIEHLWAFGPSIPNDISMLDAPPVNGLYVPVTADFDGNGFTDIAWNTGTTATIWKFHSGGYAQQGVTGLPADSAPVGVIMDAIAD